MNKGIKTKPFSLMTVGRCGWRALKAALWAFAALANSVGAHGQGTMGHFTNITAYLHGSCEVPPNDSAYTGSASFSYNLFGYNPLSNTVVACRVDLALPFSPTSAGVYGPAAPNRTAPLLFDLGQSCIVTTIVTIIIWPWVPDPPTFTNVSVVYTNALTLTPQQMNDFNSGLWYVDVASLAYPAGEIRGQLNGVPMLSQPSSQGGSGFSFKATGLCALNYEVDVSTNLLSWVAFTNMNATNGLFQVVDPDATNHPCRFYRVRSL